MTRRAQYLQALGIDLWTVRPPAPPPLGGAALAGHAAGALAPDASSAAALSAIDTVATDTVGAAGADEASWQALQAEVSGCRRCTLCETRTQTVFGVGHRGGPLLVVGEAPGADEDRQGEPFVGKAGQLLNAMLRALGHPRETVYIANVLKCRPPGNREPSAAEVASCLPYLQRQIALLGPRAILVVGRIAAQSLLATDLPIGRLRGRVHRFGAGGTPLIATYHPAYLLRSPGEKRRAWADLKLAREQLGS